MITRCTGCSWGSPFGGPFGVSFSHWDSGTHFRAGVETKGGTTTHPYTPKEEAKAATILKERREKKEAKKKALLEEQAAKLKKIEEEMAREKERLKKEKEVKLKEVEEEEEDDQPLKRRRWQRGQTGEVREDEMEKRISEWVANLSLGEEEEVAMYIPKDEQEAAVESWDAEEDPLKRQAMEDETRMEWKLRMMREKKRRVDTASEAAKELEAVKNLKEQLTAQVDLQRKVEIIAQNVERLARGQEEQYAFSRSQDMAVRSMRMGFRDFARELVGAVGAEVKHRLEKTERFCVGAIEGVKLATPKEEEARPHREPVKVKFPNFYSGKKEDNFDNWEANVKTYVHLQKVSPDEQVLIAIHALKEEAASFARSLVRAANCSDDVVAYFAFTPLADFLKLLHERFADVSRSVRASDQLQTIHSRQWRSARALKGVMDELVATPDHGVTETQLVNLFYRAMPDKTLQEHQGHLRQVLEKLREANFKINAKKCEWAKTQVLYLGHVLDGDGIKPEDSKIAAIRDWPTPRTLTELRSFLGLANYYRKFVRNFSTIAAPLRRLLRKETIWKWDKDCTSAMKKLTQALIEYPVLKVADPSLPIVVTTDASQYNIGVVLQQDDGNGYRPVEFMSARMPSEKVATSTYARELYALRQALEHWKHYLLGRHFKVYSDHETLRWLKMQAKMTPKLTRWAAEIDQYDFELKAVEGKYNVVADTLSRSADYFGEIVHYLDIGRDLQQKVKDTYAQDPVYSDLLKKVTEAPENEPDYRTTDGLLFEKTNVVDRLCIPNSEEIRSLILGECHDIEGHFGWQKTLANLMHAYTWPGMKNDCIEYVRSCKVCQRNKTTTRAPLGLLRPLPIPDQPGDSVSIDFMDAGVKSRHGKSQVMVIVDRFSKYAVFIPLPSEAWTELVIRKFFDHWVSEHGVPLSIVSDRDTRFTSQNWQELMRVYGSKLLMSSDRHPETNGQTEQMNKILQQVLRMHIRPDQVDWDEMLPKVASAYNNSAQLSTCRTPNELHKSFRPRRPFEGLNRDQIHRLPPGTREFAIQHEKELATVVENLRKAQHRMIEQTNKHRRPSQFQVGDLVWVKAKEFAPEENISQKLLPAYRGLWPVLEVKGEEDGPSYSIEIPLHLHTYPVFHASKLLPCTVSDQFPSGRSMIPPDMDGRYNIDDIVGEDVFRTGGRGRPQKHYKVRFAYQEPEDDWWFTRTELLETAPDIVRAYEKDRKGKGPALD
ncbi:hypothetical protein CBR_g12288 [Chara braunii]|uniref:Integrase catalytic domain-containing protein n=1 Tax=Chara braunii TaxID=69332 RepID=A0A388KRQ5_CHABU|nr:hypothetical protein CBR_g12288 [Chara braunii]|eukprot:GBG72719.1 hypothetical protein CBR_g12288 [Chara braunii]